MIIFWCLGVMVVLILFLFLNLAMVWVVVFVMVKVLAMAMTMAIVAEAIYLPHIFPMFVNICKQQRTTKVLRGWNFFSANEYPKEKNCLIYAAFDA